MKRTFYGHRRALVELRRTEKEAGAEVCPEAESYGVTWAGVSMELVDIGLRDIELPITAAGRG